MRVSRNTPLDLNEPVRSDPNLRFGQLFFTHKEAGQRSHRFNLKARLIGVLRHNASELAEPFRSSLKSIQSEHD